MPCNGKVDKHNDQIGLREVLTMTMSGREKVDKMSGCEEVDKCLGKLFRVADWILHFLSLWDE